MDCLLGLVEKIKEYYSTVYCTKFKLNNFILKIENKAGKNQKKKTDNYIFAIVEGCKDRFCIEEYTYTLTSLENVFQEVNDNKNDSKTTDSSNQTLSNQEQLSQKEQDPNQNQPQPQLHNQSKNHADPNDEKAEDSFLKVQSDVSIGRFVFKICENVIFTLIALLAIAFTIFTILNTDNSIISSGISILGVDISGLDKEAATDKVSAYVQESLGNNDVVLKHNEFETNIAPEQIETKINVLSAIDAAFDIGSGNNIFTNSFRYNSMFFIILFL